MPIQPTAKIAPAINWYAGMMLAPQHFQETDLRWQQLATHRFSLIAPYGYGVVAMRYDEVLLPQGYLRILELKALLQDGEVIDFAVSDKNQRPIELDLKDYKGDGILVWCGLPKWNPDVSPLDKENPRLHSIEGKEVRDYQDPSSVVTIPRLEPIVSLYLSDKPKADMVSIGILKIRHDGGIYKLCDYMPPSFDFEPDDLIFRSVISLCTDLRQKAQYLSNRYRMQMGSMQAVYTKEILKPLQQVLPILEYLNHDDPTHPYVWFDRLLYVLGALSALRPMEVLPKLPTYDHDDLLGTFLPFVTLIKELVSNIAEEYNLIPFFEQEAVFSMPIHLEEDELLIGVRFPLNISTDQRREWIDHLVIASASVLDNVIENRVIGADRTIVPREEFPKNLYCIDDVLVRVKVDQRHVLPKGKLILFNPMDGGKPTPEGLFLCARCVPQSSSDREQWL